MIFMATQFRLKTLFVVICLLAGAMGITRFCSQQFVGQDKLDLLRDGLTEAQVIEQVGESNGIYEAPDGTRTFLYSRFLKSTVAVSFGPDGKVDFISY